jgi:hypothetical protein
MMLGREVLLPLDLMYGLPPGEPETHTCPTAYTEWLRETLRRAHRQAMKNNEQALRSQKRYYDVGKKELNLQPGVWVYWKIEGKKSKFDPAFEGPWCITEKLNEVNYRISPCDNGPSKVTHIDKLKLCTGDHPADFVVPPQKEIPTQTELLVIPGQDTPVPEFKSSTSNKRKKQVGNLGIKKKGRETSGYKPKKKDGKSKIKINKRKGKREKQKRRLSLNSKNISDVEPDLIWTHLETEPNLEDELNSETESTSEIELNSEIEPIPENDLNAQTSPKVKHDQGPQVTTRVGRKIKLPARFANQVQQIENNAEETPAPPAPSLQELNSMLDTLVEILTNPSNDELRALVEERLETVEESEVGNYRVWMEKISPQLNLYRVLT